MTSTGTLNHVCLVVPDGRLHLLYFNRFRAGFKEPDKPFIRHKVHAKLLEDVAWWRAKLSQEFLGISITKPPPILDDPTIYVDASTNWGLGLVINGRWLAWEYKSGWKSDGREIGWSEMAVVELAICTFINHRRSKSPAHIRIYSDNEGVVFSVRSKDSKGPQRNAILCEIVKLMQAHDVWVTTEWVSTHNNPADGPSRGVFPPRSKLFAYPPKIPDHLEPFIQKSVNFHDARLNS